MDRAIPGRPEPLDLPAELPAGEGSAVRVLAAREASAAGVRQAFVFRTHDVVGLTALLAPGDGRGWRALDALWSDACPIPGADVEPLGAVRLYRGLTGRSARLPGAADRLTAAVRRGAPTEPAAAWSAPHAVPSHPFVLWEQLGAAGSRLRYARRMVILAGARHEPELDDWTWTSGEPGLTPLGHYLLHAAKLRYEARVFTAGTGFRRIRADTEQALDDLIGLDHRSPDEIEEFLTAARRLARLRAGRQGLITALTRLRALRRTAQIAAANMTAAVGEESFLDPAGPFARDRDTARWLAEQVEDDVLYLEATDERARETGPLTDGVVQRWQQQRQQQVVLLQTSLLGAALMALTTVQALQYQLPLPAPLRASLIAALSTAALSLPTAVLRWLRGSGEEAPLSWPDIVSVSLFGACLSWFGTAAGVYAASHRALSLPAVLAAALPAGAATCCGAYLVLRRRRARLREDAPPHG
jgi:hypothetical protein